MEAPRIEDYYTLGKEIGKGSFSSVVVGHHKTTGGYFAVKIVPKSEINSGQLDRIYREIEILSTCRHPNVVNLVEYFDEDSIYLVTELKTGGELFDRILSKGFYNESEARVVLGQIGHAVQYLHAHGIVHRDLKPENMLFDTMAPDSIVCIADFGFARFIATNELLATPCGTPGYVAPEIANAGRYDKAVDMWSLGVIMYTLLCGFPPFFSEDDDELLELVAAGDYSFPEPFWDNISEEAKELIGLLLEREPALRLTADQFLQHPWFCMGAADSLSIKVPDLAVAEVSASFATLMSPTARAFLAGIGSESAGSPLASWPRRLSNGGTANNNNNNNNSGGIAGVGGTMEAGDVRRLTTSMSDASAQRRLSNSTLTGSGGYALNLSGSHALAGGLSSMDPWLAARRLSIGSGWISSGMTSPTSPPIDGAGRRFSTGGGVHSADMHSAGGRLRTLTMSTGSVGAFGIPFGSGYSAYLVGGLSSSDVATDATAGNLRTSVRSTRAFPLGPTTPPAEFSTYAQALGFGTELPDEPLPIMPRPDTLRARPPPSFESSPGSEDTASLGPAGQSSGRAALMASANWSSAGLTSSDEHALDSAGDRIAPPLSPLLRPRPTGMLYHSIDEPAVLAALPSEPKYEFGSLPSLLDGSVHSMPRGMHVELPHFGAVLSEEPMLLTPPAFGLRVSTELAYPLGRSRAASMLSSGSGPSSPSMTASAVPSPTSIEQKQLICVLGKSITVARDGVPLRASCDSSTWRERQRKRSGPPLPTDAGWLCSSPKTLRQSGDFAVRDFSSPMSDEEAYE